MILSLLAFGLSAPVAATEIHSAEIVEITDHDGDGRASGLVVRARADMAIDESGSDYTGGVFEKRGHPSFIVLFNTPRGTVDSGMYRQPGRDHSGWFELHFSRDDMQEVRRLAEVRDESQRELYNLDGVLNGEIEIRSLEIRYLESDTHPEADKRFKGQWKWTEDNDALVDSTVIELDAPLRLEPPEKDRLAEVRIDSEPSGASVYLSGEHIGKTPLTREFPVDLAEGEARMQLRLEKDGYRPLERHPDFSPPAERIYTLDKAMGEIRIDSEPAGATVRIDGTKVGETPMATERHTIDRVDIRLEMEGYKTARLEGVTAPLDRNIALEATEARKQASAEAAAEVADVATGRSPVPPDLESAPGRDLPSPGQVPELDLPVEDSAPAVDMSGTWDTDFGALRLVQTAGYVVGDYADQGILVGRVQGECVAGIFTNGARNGRFRFDLRNESAFIGQWGWHGESLDGEWNGERIESDTPAEFRNFTPGDATIRPGDSDRGVYDGAYDSNHGELALLSRDQILVGDHASDGVLAGMWNGSAFVGQFTEGERTGYFELRFFSKDGAFRDGSRWWVGDSSEPETWSLERRSRKTPEPDNMSDDIRCK